MMPLHLCGAAMLMLFGWFCGELMQRRIHQQLLILQQYQVLINFLEQTIAFQKLPCPQLLQLVKQNGTTFSALELNHCDDLREYRLPDLLSHQESDALNMIFSIIGTKHSAELHSFFEYSRSQCLLYETLMLKKCKQADELYTRLGLFFGAVIAIFLF